MATLQLREHSTSAGVALISAEVDGLRLLVPSVQIQPSPGANGRYDLRPDSDVGVVRIGELIVDIRPKLSIPRVLFLLSYVAERRWWRDDDVPLAEDVGLVEAMIPGFVFQVRRAFRRGLLQGYQTREEALPLVRGRIRFDDQVRRQYGRLPPVEVRYDDFTEDIEPNRLIKAAATRLRRLPLRSRDFRRLLAELDSALAPVADVTYRPHDLPEIPYNRLNEHYRPAVELARLILRSASFELSYGGVRAMGCLVDMNRVFEDFVVVALRDRLGLTDREFPQQAAGRQLWLDRERRLRLEPDVSWWEGARPVFVGDAKYKRTKADKARSPDVYQVLAYAVAADLPGAVLIYAAGEGNPASHRVVHLDKTVEVLTMDLDGPPSAVLREVDRVAARLAAWRRAAVSP